MAMGQTSGSLASGTGMTAITIALATAVQVIDYWVFGEHASLTNEQAGAFAVLLYPFVHLFYAKIGYDPRGAAVDKPPDEPATPLPASSGTPTP